MGKKIKVGIIGCGNISRQYVKGCRLFDILAVTACADIDPAKAEELAKEFNLKPLSVAELLADPTIEIVVNLTLPASHAEVSLAIIAAGKHVQSEKPLAISRADGQQILAAGQAQGVRVGCAPDTFLGGGLQTCRQLIDEGTIGTPVGATAFMMGSGPESWHPNPSFFYQHGAGPMFDIGPYYLTTLIHLLGPVARVSGATRISFPERVAHTGERIPVTVPTYVAGLLNFASGPIVTLITTFDVAGGSNLPHLEIYGEQGTLRVPDPNTFEGPVLLRQTGGDTWREMPLTHNSEVLRGIGVADMATAIVTQQPHRTNGEMAYHVLDLMHAFEESSQSGQHIQIKSRCRRPAPLPAGLPKGRLANDL